MVMEFDGGYYKEPNYENKELEKEQEEDTGNTRATTTNHFVTCLCWTNF
jgi:hypothetical protein